MWGLEIRILNEEGNVKKAKEIVNKINEQLLAPTKFETVEEVKISENKSRNKKTLEDINYEKEITESVKENDIKNANVWRFIALFELIGYTETGFYPKLNKNKDRIEKIIKTYIEEILK